MTVPKVELEQVERDDERAFDWLEWLIEQALEAEREEKEAA